MKTVKHTITINGVETSMLFTPRLFEFKTPSMDFSTDGGPTKVIGIYADIAYCAALNYWTLADKDIDVFPHTRLDFHEWAALYPVEFGKLMRIAIEAITNKSIDDLVKNETKDKPKGELEVKKKTSSSIIQKLKHFLWGVVGCRKDKQQKLP